MNGYVNFIQLISYNSGMLSVGLTGNFGMGKSTVLRFFNELGAYTYDVDAFVHNLLEHPETINKISGVIGRNILTKGPAGISINKRLLADIIFNDPGKRKSVERVIHPEVLKEIRRIASGMQHKAPPALLVFEVPLLFEAGYKDNFDKIIVVCCDQEIALKRLAEKGFSREDALRRIRSQMPIEEKKRFADFTINNNDSNDMTRLQTTAIYEKLISLLRI